MKPTRKMSFLLLMAALTTVISSRFIPESYLQETSDNPLIRSIRQKMQDYATRLPEERVYLQFDKPFYEPGDDIWFAAYLRDGASLKASPVSDILHVELINPRGGVEKKISLVLKNGKVAGDFSLDKGAPGGIYQVKAYTNWMKNEGEENAFTRELQVQEVILPRLKMKLDFEKKAFGAGDLVMAKISLNTNENKPLAGARIKILAQLNGQTIAGQTETTDAEGLKYLQFRLPEKLSSHDGLLNVMVDYEGSTESISRSIPIVLNKIKFDLYPEGGDLVEGIASTVAFRALNEFGKPADVEGVVMSSKGTRIAAFSSFHNGMGAFRLDPQPGEKYLAIITKPAGIREEFPLPDALERGYVMTVHQPAKEEISVSVNTTETDELSLVAQVRGKVCYSAVLPVTKGHSNIIFSTREFPAGVAQLTLFDSKGIPRAERLVFVNKHRQLRISVQPEKEKYLPREKVRLHITVKDERGLPVPANLSMAVVNDQLLSFADNRSGHILSQLLLEQDLKGKIEEPAFYFDPKEAKADQALDKLLMTAGWRRFTWEKLLEDEWPAVRFQPQKALLSGVIINGHSQQPVPHAKIRDAKNVVYTADANGRFEIRGADLSEPYQVSYSADGFYEQQRRITEYGQDLRLYLYNGQYRLHQKRAASGRGVPAIDQDMEMMVPQMAMAESTGMIKEKNPEPAADKMPAKVQEKKQEKPAKGLASGMVRVADRRAELFVGAPVDEMKLKAGNVYYRARQFAAPDYKKQDVPETRTDFRNTIYWNPAIEIGYSGKKTLEFYASDDVTSFRAIAEGIGMDGLTGRCEQNFFTQLPFQMTTRLPVELATGDLVSIPVTLKNNTGAPLGGVLSITAPAGLKAVRPLETVQTIMPGAAKTIYMEYKVRDTAGTARLTVGFKSCGLGDAFTQEIRIVPKGFPVQVSFSGQEADREYVFDMKNMVNGSLKASVTAFPNVVSDLMKGVEGILQEPYGCFEQTSCTAYPNAMVLGYLKHTGSSDTKVLARATELLDRGYKRLTTFESPDKGYEWFGANPAHEGLTAYGIMEFVDMQKAGQSIDQKMLERTAGWLLSHRDGKGGFERERRALHDFGRISDNVLNAYIVYALAEAGYKDISREFAHSYDIAVREKDAYLLALMANAAYSLGDHKKGNLCLEKLLAMQAGDGSFTGSSHSITYSQGSSLSIETTALAAMAIMKAPAVNNAALSRSVKFLVGARSGSGVFSSTQGTILALKALTAYAVFSKRTVEDGTILIYIDGKKVAEKHYKAGEQSQISLEGLERHVCGEGRHTLRIRFAGVKNPLPYAAAINWHTALPASDEACALDLQTSVSARTVRMGETLRLKVRLSNKENRDIPSTMALIGIPAGFSAQPWQLKELQEKKAFDYYEIKGNTLALYYRGMGALALKEINLDLKAEIPGSYEAPASCAYLYYTNEYKRWTATDRVTITRN